MTRLDQDGCLLRVTGLPPAAWPAVRAALTVPVRRHEPGVGFYTESVALYEERNGVLYCGAGLRARLAARLATAGLPYEIYTDERHAGGVYEYDLSCLAPPTELRPGQFDIIQKFMTCDRGTFLAPTGHGKSWLMAVLARLCPKARVDYVTFGTDLCEQTYTDFCKVLPSVGRYGAGRRKPGRVRVVNVDSAHHTGYDADIVLADEIDELCAPRFMAQLGNYGRGRPCRMYGFTASYERDDGQHRVLEAVFGPPLATITYQEAQAAGSVVPITVEWVRPAVPVDPGAGLAAGPQRMRLGIWQNWARNQAIADRALAAGSADQVLVLVETVEHAFALKRLLPDYEVCYAPSDSSDGMREQLQRLGLLDAAEPVMTTARRNRLRTQFSTGDLRRAIATRVWVRGVNFRRLPLLIRADALSSQTRTRQSTGRLSRTFEGKTGGLLVDFWDDWSAYLIRASQARRAVYRELGFTQLNPPPRPRPVSPSRPPAGGL